MKILLKNKQSRLGDALMFTPVVRDYKATFPDHELYVDCAYHEIFYYNPHISGFHEPGVKYDKEIGVGPKDATFGSKTNGLHITESFAYGLRKNHNIIVKQGLLRPDLHLSTNEKKNKIIDGDYWLIAPSHGIGYSSKEWIKERWQEVVNELPWITFVQIGNFTNPFFLQGNNVINYVGKTENLRDLFKLFYHCKGFVGLISGGMHIAGAFGKPAVIIAGAREPVTFEKYENQQFISNIGCLSCAKEFACWAGNKDSCFVKMYEAGYNMYIHNCNDPVNISDDFNIREYAKKHKRANHVPKCLDMVTSKEVIISIDKYYQGSVIKLPQKPATIRKRKVFRIVSNGKFYGGAERSVVQICKMMQEEGYKVELVTRHSILCNEMQEVLPDGVIHTDIVTSPCDILMLYASDMVWDFDKQEFDVFNILQAKRKIIALTYKFGKIGIVEWCDNFDKYLFLSSQMKSDFDNQYNGKGIAVALPPPVDLSEFYKVNINYNNSVRIARHSSQGDKKYPRYINNIVNNCKDAKFYFMPSPPINGNDIANENIVCYAMNQLNVTEFLSKANVFWYLLPEGYTDQGPRVIIEAMAAGMPIITEKRYGMADRVNEETGWFVTHKNCAELINSLTYEEIKKKGQAAREFAKQNFNPYNWVKEIIG